MAMIGLRVPHETSRLFNDIEVSGQKTEVSSYHVTIMYLGKERSIDQLADAMKATFAVTSQTRPFSVRTSRVTSFPSNEDGVPVIARVESDPLHDLKAKLVESFRRRGVEFSNKYPDYKPHVTLAWAEEPVEEFRIPTIEWGAHEIVLWGGDTGDKKLIVTFPLSMNTTMAEKVAARYLGKSVALGLGP